MSQELYDEFLEVKRGIAKAQGGYISRFLVI